MVCTSCIVATSSLGICLSVASFLFFHVAELVKATITIAQVIQHKAVRKNWAPLAGAGTLGESIKMPKILSAARAPPTAARAETAWVAAITNPWCSDQ